jgi:hypothetical protein
MKLDSSEIELFHCTVHIGTSDALRRVAKGIHVDGGIFENVLL